MVLIRQEWEVNALGLHGEGSVRLAFSIVYLGAQAMKQLDQVRDRGEREGLREWLSKQKRPAMVSAGGQWFACPIPDIKPGRQG